MKVHQHLSLWGQVATTIRRWGPTGQFPSRNNRSDLTPDSLLG